MDIALYQRLVNKRNVKKVELRNALDENKQELVRRLTIEIQTIQEEIEDLEEELEDE
jgi:hypothetical protein